MMPESVRIESAATRGALAVTGSKGGVGKSNLVVNLAIALGRNGRRVLLVDGDLGLANLDVLLGLVPVRTIEHLVRGEAGVKELLLEGPGGIHLLPAASGIPDLAKLDGPTRDRLLEALSDCSSLADAVLVDTGAGLGDTTLALQLAASRVVVVTTAEPTSMVDAYASLKVLWSADPDKPVDLVVNDVETYDDAQRSYDQIAKASRHFLGREPGWLGPVFRDPSVGESVRRQRAVLDLYPTSRAARCYERIALQIAANPAIAGHPEDYWRHLLVSPMDDLPH
jgi:flagellar biosynthesis protein FlhG